MTVRNWQNDLEVIQNVLNKFGYADWKEDTAETSYFVYNSPENDDDEEQKDPLTIVPQDLRLYAEITKLLPHLWLQERSRLEQKEFIFEDF